MDTLRSSPEDHVGLETRYGASLYRPLPVVVARAEGAWVEDVDGRRFLDLHGAISSVNQGHVHPSIRRVLIEQSGRVAMTSRSLRNDALGPFLRDLAERTGFSRSILMNSGAEAVETAIKLARKWGHVVRGVPDGAQEIVVFGGCFHGRTTTLVSFSDTAAYRDGFGPLSTGFVKVPFGDLDAARAAIGPATVAVLVEPIQGEAGVVVPPAGFLSGLARACRDAKVLLMCDEIQCGLGRTGKLFAFEHEGIRPDVAIVGKSLGGGFLPLSAVLADDPVMGVLRPGDHGSTFGGNPLAAAVGREALRVLFDEGMIENAATLGAYFLGRLRAIRSPSVREVRGRGLWAGVEVAEETGGARRFVDALLSRGVLCKETHGWTLRFAPPLTISREDLDWGLERVEAALTEDA